MDTRLIGVPIMYGCDRQGAQYGPKKLREKGIIDIIKKHHQSVYDFGDIYIPDVSKQDKYAYHKKIKYLKPIVDINTNLAHSVYNTLVSDDFPFIFGGDHSLALGSIAGTSKFYNDLAVIWIDAHGDINTDETSPSGNFHGMPLSTVLGKGDPSLVNIYFDGQKVKPENVYIIGARDLDEGEIQIAKNLDLTLYTIDDIRKFCLDTIIDEVINSIKSSGIDNVHLSFDIDVLDKSIVPGTGTPVGNGFSLKEGKKILKAFLRTGMIKSMDFVELNPQLDEDDVTANLCIDLIDCIFENLKLSTPIKGV